MTSPIQQIRKLLIRPAIVTYVFAAALFVGNLAFTQHIRPYNSDDVAYQNIVTTWHPFSGRIVTLGSSDNMVDKIPFYMLFGKLLGASPRVIFIEATFFGLLGFTLFYMSSLYFLYKARIKLNYRNLLPFIWLASFGHNFSQLFLNPSWRGFELGIAFALVALVAMVFYRDIEPLRSVRTKIVTILVTIGVGILIYSDPYFVYFMVGPLLLFSLILLAKHVISRTQFFVVYGGGALSYIFAKLTSLFVHAAGVRMATAYPTQFVTYDQLGDSFSQTLHSVLIIFGADPFGRKPVSGSALSALLDLLLVCCIFVAIYRLWKTRQSKPGNMSTLRTSRLWQLYFGFVGLLSVVLYACSTVADGISTYRYLIMLVLGGVLVLAMAMNSAIFTPTTRTILSCVLVVATVLNLGVAIRSTYVLPFPGAVNDRGNTANLALIHTLRENGLSTGYADYWQANIDTYLSGQHVNVLPAYCANDTVLKFHWLIDESRFSATRTTHSFFIYDPYIPAFSSTCTQSELLARLGAPSKTIVIDGRIIYLFPYDISSKLQ